MNKKLKIGLIFLNIILFLGIIVGQYEWLEPKSVIHIFIIPAFIISASLLPIMNNSNKNRKEKN